MTRKKEGELTAEMEKRGLDFALNEVYGECAARWRLHYRRPPRATSFVALFPASALTVRASISRCFKKN